MTEVILAFQAGRPAMSVSVRNTAAGFAGMIAEALVAVPAAGPEVDYPLARLQGPQRERVPDPGEGLDRPVRQCVNDVGRIAEQRGQGLAGVEVELAVGVQRHLPVPLPHVSAQGLRIDRNRVRHAASPFVQIDA
jgi:hypothetical protein